MQRQHHRRGKRAGPARLPRPDSPWFTCYYGKDEGLREGAPFPGGGEFTRMLELMVARPLLDGNEITILVNGDRFFPAMLELIRGARRTITLEIYIWQSGEISERFIEALTERARAGVKVHVMGDGVGLIKMKRRDIDRLKEGGVHFVFFERSRSGKIRANINHRTHRKILVVDGRVAITGGVCIADAWQGDATDRDHWRDNGYLVRGPMVNQMQAVFAENWLDTTSQLLCGDSYFPPLDPAGPVRAHFYQTQPSRHYSNMRKSLFFALCSARSHIRLAHAYFVPDDEAIQLLIEARKRKVRVEIVVPSVSDTATALAVMRSRLRPLLENGVEIYLFSPAMFHCKYLIIDDIFTSVGSSNFDPRSFRMNDEADISAVDREFAARHIEVFERDKGESTPYRLKDHDLRPVHSRFADTVMGCFWRLF